VSIGNSREAVATPKFQIYSDAAGKYRWRLKDADGEKVALSGDSFTSASEAKHAAKLVKETAPDAVIED
jgi:uncharacterized protein YegP (UPF0339 family)